jgi:hypothetical protein
VFLQMAMQGFTEKIVGMMKSEKLFASQGGPIILSQASIITLFLLNVKFELYPVSLHKETITTC